MSEEYYSTVNVILTQVRIVSFLVNKADPDFHQDDICPILSASWRIDFCLLNFEFYLIHDTKY